MFELLLQGHPIGKIKAVLFDKDGTLSNSESHLLKLSSMRVKEAIKRFHSANTNNQTKEELESLLYKSYGQSSDRSLKPTGTIAVASRKDNLTTTATIFCLMGETWPNSIELAQEVFKTVDKRINELPTRSERNHLLPGAMKMLNELSSNGVICALISNDSRSGIQGFLRDNKLTDKFSCHFWSAEHIPTKPDPGAIKGLCHSLGLAPEECAMVGDSDSDMRMAREANIKISLGYISGWTSTPLLTAQDHIIEQWDDFKVETTTNIAHNLNQS